MLQPNLVTAQHLSHAFGTFACTVGDCQVKLH